MFIYFINPVIIYTSREIFHEMCKRFVCFITKCMFTYSDLVHCALAVVRRSQKIRPTTDPFPGARDGQNLISWRWSLPLPTNPVWWGSMHAISSYRGNRPTNTQTHKQTGAITIHCAATSPARSVKVVKRTHYCCSDMKVDKQCVLYDQDWRLCKQFDCLTNSRPEFISS